VTERNAPAGKTPARGAEAPEPDAEASEEPSGDALELLWKRALEAWDDPKPHAALLELALQTERLPDLAGRYRALVGDAEKGAVAKKRIDAILAAATQLLMSMKTPKPAKNPPWLLGIAAVFFVVTMGYLAWAIVRR
jgi:hypothetical protein